jgi:putative membrane protein
MAAQPGKPGLQAERTQLAWERSAIGFLAGGAIPLLREGGPLAVGRTLLAVMAVLLALLVVVLARARAHRFRATPRTEVVLIGWATAGFATTIVVLLMLSW